MACAMIAKVIGWYYLTLRLIRHINGSHSRSGNNMRPSYALPYTGHGWATQGVQK